MSAHCRCLDLKHNSSGHTGVLPPGVGTVLDASPKARVQHSIHPDNAKTTRVNLATSKNIPQGRPLSTLPGSVCTNSSEKYSLASLHFSLGSAHCKHPRRRCLSHPACSSLGLTMYSSLSTLHSSPFSTFIARLNSLQLWGISPIPRCRAPYPKSRPLWS